MKKMLLLSKICLMALCLIFCSLSVYAVTDNVPKTINLQGRYTRNYGDPIANTQMRVYFQVKKGSNWESVQGSPFSTTTDSEGLYNLNVTVSNFSSDMTHFRVGIDNEPTGDGYAFSSSPYAIYSSTSAYALSLDPVNGEKLIDGNFKSDTTYNITVANAVLATTANNALKVSTETASSKKGFVWGITDNSGTQAWVDPGEIQIHEATTSILGGILLGNSDTGLVMKGDNKTLKINNGAGLIINSSNQLVLDFGNIDSNNTTKSVTGKAIYDELAKKQDTLTNTNVIQTGNGNVVDSVTASNGVLTITKNTTLAAVATSGSYTDLNNTPAIPQGTVTSVRVQATSPVVSSQNTEQTETLNTTISLADAYGDTKNPYGSKNKNYVLAAPSGSNGNPSFRALVKADIPLASETAASGGTTTSLVTTGEKYTWNTKQDALAVQTVYTAKGSATKVPQITTNNLGQVTSISEVTITQPTVNNKTITIQRNNVDVGSFTLNQSTDKTINITVPTQTSDLTNDSNFIADSSYVHTDSNYTSEEKTKLSGIAESAQVNVLEGVQVNGSDLPISNKKVNISIDNTSIITDSNVLKTVGINSTATTSMSGNSIQVWANGSGGQGWYTISKQTDYHNANISGADLAEIYQSSEKLVPGDVVSIDTTKDNAIVKTKVAEDTLVAGVISTEPGVLMNQKEKGYKLALVGKVPTKVCNEGGAVKRGDLLVSASIPGYAKKAGDNPKVGTVIGKALENLDSQKGTILVLVNLQ